MDDSLYHAFFEQEQSHWWFAARTRIVRRVVERHGRISPGDRILDIGCGTGALLASLADTYDVIGIDPSPLAVEYAKRRGLANIFPMDAAGFLRERSRVKLALLLDVIEHIDDDVGTLRAAGRIVEPDGCVIITVPAHMWMWSAHDVVNHHQRRYSRTTLRAAIAAAGLVVTRLTYFNTLLFPPIAVAKLLARLRGATSAHVAPAGRLPFGNAILEAIFSAERHMMSRVNLPFGVSLLAVARPVAAVPATTARAVR